MSSFNVEIADARFFRLVFAVLVFAAISSMSGTVLALLMGPSFPSWTPATGIQSSGDLSGVGDLYGR